MSVLSLVELQVSVPPGVRVAEKTTRETWEYRLVEGPSVGMLLSEIEAICVKAGFVARRVTEDDLYLVRDDQTISLTRTSGTALLVGVDDPRASPSARVENGRACLHDVSIVFDADRIIPGRERHFAGSKEWRADWTVVGPSVSALSEQLMVEFVRMGLRPGSFWPSLASDGGWVVGAYSADRSLRAEVSPTVGGCIVHVLLMTS